MDGLQEKIFFTLDGIVYVVNLVMNNQCPKWQVAYNDKENVNDAKHVKSIVNNLNGLYTALVSGMNKKALMEVRVFFQLMLHKSCCVHCYKILKMIFKQLFHYLLILDVLSFLHQE